MAQRAKFPRLESSMIRSSLAPLARLVLLGALSTACSAPSRGETGWFGGPSSEIEKPPFDPQALGASLLCDWADPSGDARPFVFVLSALNHKLATYPEFAAHAGFNAVSECGDAQRFVDAYNEYSLVNPGFDADEPLGETPDEGEPEVPTPNALDGEQDTSKIAGATETPSNYPVVQLTYQTCKRVGGNPTCLDADLSWEVHGHDYRNWHESCSGTFISKNWILTAAHCMVWPAIDQCMHDGVKREDCKPNWDLYGTWHIQGSFRTGPGPDGLIPSEDDRTDRIDGNFQARGYIMKENWSAGTTEHWAGTDLSKVDTTCDKPNCFNAGLIADHDLALVYLSSTDDVRLPPRPEEDAAKRLSIVAPPTNVATAWPLAIAGWGNPGDNVLRQGTGGLGAIAVTSNRLDVTTTGSTYACSGDSGGPVLRTGLGIGPRTGLQAVVAVMSMSKATCTPAAPPPGTEVFWIGTRVDTSLHQQFIKKTFHRWPNYKHFDCVPRKLGSPPPQGAVNEVEECWGARCTEAGGLPNGCPDGQYCNGPGTLIARRGSEIGPVLCDACDTFTEIEDQGCGCIWGQCLPL